MISDEQRKGIKDLNESLNNLIAGILAIHESSSSTEESMARMRRAFRMDEPKTGAEE